MRRACFRASAAAALLLLLGSAPGLAQGDCECLWEGSFVEAQASADLVVSGSVVAVKGNAVDLLIERELRGEAYSPTVRIWMKTGDYCRPEVEEFPEDSQWVMALHRIDEAVEGAFNPFTPNQSYGRVGDYRLSACGGYWLSRSGEWVSGNLVGAPRWVRDPKMTPVLLDLVAGYVAGELPAETLAEASREDPALRELRINTKTFLRGEN